MENEVKYKVIKPLYDTEIRYIDEVKGYGVFTNVYIPKDSIVEICYSLKLKRTDVQHPNYDYLFYYYPKDEHFFPFGNGVIYNHSFDPNLRWEIVDYNKNILQFMSNRDINPNEELCHNYGEIYWKAREKKLL